MVLDEAGAEDERDREVSSAPSSGVARSHGLSSGSPMIIFAAVQTSTPAPR